MDAIRADMVTKRQHRWVVGIGATVAAEILLAHLGLIPSVL